MVSSTALVALGLSILLGSLYEPLVSNGLFATQKFNEWDVVAKNVLLVTAHPDDEAMFFAPTILGLTEKEEDTPIVFHHVCLSVGDAEGLGQTRKLELGKSLDVLGVDKKRRWVLDHPELRDGMETQWEPTIVADVLQPYVLDLGIDTILTFDDTGVSKHPNHIAAFRGVQTLIKRLGESSSNKRIRLFTLFSASLPFKYISILSVPLGKMELYFYWCMVHLEQLVIQTIGLWDPEILTPAIPQNPDGYAMPTFIAGHEHFRKALNSMQAHESQLVWFRYLYLGFSRFMWINTWVADRTL